MVSERDFERITEVMRDGLYFVDFEGRITFWNKAAERITGFGVEEVLGDYSGGFLPQLGGGDRLFSEGTGHLADAMADGRVRDTNVAMRHKEGHKLSLSVRATPLTDEEGAIVGGMELFRDAVSGEALRSHIDELEKLALVDPLTGTANRRHAESEIFSHLEALKRHGMPFGILFLDIDNFKTVNDTHGHDLGDSVLRAVADTLVSSIRPFDTIGRWGGDEFLGVFPNVDVPTLCRISERMRAMTQDAWIRNEDNFPSVTLSIGGTLAKPEDTVDVLVKRADAHMYASKGNGRNHVTIGA